MTSTAAFFIGHGSPMNTLEDNDYTRAWRSLGEAFPKPKAILAISAHWYFGATAITAMANPRTIHDFYGFPQELFDVEYPAPGDPELAGEIVDLVKPHWVGLDRDQWGLDHGTWSVLAHIYPEADVPVIQLSLDARKPLSHHLELGRALAPLRAKGVMVIGSGNVVHNLGRLQWQKPNKGYDWAERFDEAAMRQIGDNPSDILKLAEHPDFAQAVPTEDHFLPLLYLAGIASAEGSEVETLLSGCSMGSISMTSYGIGTALPRGQEGHDAAAIPNTVPPDQTNM